MADYIVVSTPNAELTKIALGMLGAKYVTDVWEQPYQYPMQGNTYFVWAPRLSLDGTQAAFGPLDSGLEPEFGPWCLGRELELNDNGLSVSVTIPTSSQTLEPEWFAPVEPAPEPQP